MADSVLVSSCLLGLATRYDGTDNYCQKVFDYLQQHKLTPIPICPEQLAGLPTPRPKCWFSQGDGDSVLDGCGAIEDESGNDMTAAFGHAAEAACIIARLTASSQAIMKQRSPSCGSRMVYRNCQLIEGSGVTAASLRRAGLKVLSEEDL